jgi:hypothetical protein
LRQFFTESDAIPPGDVLAAFKEYPELAEIMKPVSELLVSGLEHRFQKEGPDAAMAWFSNASKEFSARARAEGSEPAMEWLRSVVVPSTD